MNVMVRYYQIVFTSERIFTDGSVAIGLSYDPDDLLDTTRLTRFRFHEYSPH